MKASRLAVLVLCAACASAPGSVVKMPELRTRLLEMMQEDQAMLLAKPVDGDALKRANEFHRARLKAIIAAHGWPTITMVGEDGSKAAWILAQHSDVEPAFQREVIARMEPLLATKEVTPTWYAYLYDRLHSPQRYGTQGGCKDRGVWAPREIEDPDHVEQRRAAMGMNKLSEYVEFASSRLCVR
jgi:hypothetical protein